MLVDPERFELFENGASPEQARAMYFDVRQSSALHPGVNGTDRLAKPPGDLAFVEKSFVSQLTES
ncbi:MAG TPA: hypothetical protein VFU09_08995 [Candidatus Udaeobacter sp.]|nr:hypothetical protein [Candidatus Udaeobacter sp.]